MGAWYLVNIDDKFIQRKSDGSRYLRIPISTPAGKDVTIETGFMLTKYSNYTIPDILSVKEEGADEAWECAEEITRMPEHELFKIFGETDARWVINQCRPYEAIKMIQQYSKRKMANES